MKPRVVGPPVPYGINAPLVATPAWPPEVAQQPLGTNHWLKKSHNFPSSYVQSADEGTLQTPTSKNWLV